MKNLKHIYLIALLIGFVSCNNYLDVPPMNIVQDKDIFTSPAGIQSYMARLYSELPIEDFRYCPSRGFNVNTSYGPPSAITGEALCRDQSSSISEQTPYYSQSYALIREANYFLETLPSFASNFMDKDVKNWTGEAYFIRAFTYFALARRYGGVPLVDHVLKYPDQSIDDLKIPRSSEEETFDFIASDFDKAITNMTESSAAGRANKYVAAAFKSRAMLHAGSIAKYNQTTLFDNNHKQLCGISRAKSATYFKASFDAAKLLDGKYSLYKKSWKAGDKSAQYQNFADLFLDQSSSENILVKAYQYPTSVHSFDAYMVPVQMQGPSGWSSETSPTLEFVEMFEGFPKNSNGTIKSLDDNGKYVFYNKTMDMFIDAEPRLRATVILPGDVFKGEIVEIRRGIYSGSVTNGVSPLLPVGSTSAYPTTNIVQSANDIQTPYTLPDGTKMNPAGASGPFVTYGRCALSGFFLRKYLNPNLLKSYCIPDRSDQSWIEMRYAEVLLNLSESACELAEEGQTGIDYLGEAFDCINKIRDRAGATILTNKSSLADLNIVRLERRKELAFENKIWWDLKRWRILDKEQNARIYRTLMPFYAAGNGKYFFDVRLSDRNWRFTFDSRWYYLNIPGAELSKNSSLIQNPGY